MNPALLLHNNSSSQNPRSSSLRSKFTHGFLRALNCINKQRPTSQFLSSYDRYRRYRKVKLAADASMAFAVGPRRAWSRAMLRKIARRRRLMPRKVRRNRPKKRSEAATAGKNNNIKMMMKIRDEEDEDEDEDDKMVFVHARELQKLVPGGQVLSLSSLLSETAHYIKCLNTQVDVMKKIADLYSV